MPTKKLVCLFLNVFFVSNGKSTGSLSCKNINQYLSGKVLYLLKSAMPNFIVQELSVRIFFWLHYLYKYMGQIYLQHNSTELIFLRLHSGILPLNQNLRRKEQLGTGLSLYFLLFSVKNGGWLNWYSSYIFYKCLHFEFIV